MKVKLNVGIIMLKLKQLKVAPQSSILCKIKTFR